MQENYFTKIGKLTAGKPRTKAGFCEALIYEPKDPDRRKYGSLYFVVEIASPHPKTVEVGKTLIEIICQEYYKDLKRDVLVSFEAALKKANQYLGDLAEEGEIFWLGKLNATCGCLHKNNLHLTATGSGEVYLLRGETLTNLASGLYSLSESPDPLKTFANISSGKFGVGDKLVLCLSSLFYNISPDELKKIVGAFSPEMAVGELAPHLEEEEDSLGISLIILEFQKEVELPKEIPSEEREAELPREVWIKPKKREAELLKEKARLGLEIFSKGLLKLAKLTKEALQKNLPPLFLKIKKASASFLSSLLKARKKIKFPQREAEFPKEALLSSEKGTELPKEKKPSLFFSSFKKELLIIFSFLKRKLTSIFSDLKTLNLADFRSKDKKRYLAIFLAALLLLGLSIGAMLIKEREATRLAQLEGLFKEAYMKEASGKAALLYGDKKQAKKFLTQAQSLASDLSKIGYRTADLSDLLSKIEEDFNLVYGIIKVNPSLLADFEMVKKDISSEGLYYLGGNFYSLGEKEIYQYSKEEKTPKIAFSGPFEGSFKFAHLKSEEFLLYSEPSQIWKFNPQTNSLTKISLPLAENWKGASDMASYLDYLYLLCPSENQIYRYFKTYSGYSKGYPYLLAGQNIDLGEAKSIAISDFVYVLVGGKIVKFSQGSLVDFAIKDLEPKLKNPTKIYTRWNLENLYLLEPEEKRIVVLSDDGSFVKQYRSDLFSEAKGLWVEEKDKKIYLLSGNKIYQFDLK